MLNELVGVNEIVGVTDIIALVSGVISMLSIIVALMANRHSKEANKIADKYSALNESHTVDEQTKEILSLYADIHYRTGTYEATKAILCMEEKNDDKDEKNLAAIYLLTLIVAMEPLLNYIQNYTENTLEYNDNPDANRANGNSDFLKLINLSSLKDFSNIVKLKLDQNNGLKKSIDSIRPGLCDTANVVIDYYEKILSFREISNQFDLQFDAKDKALMVGIKRDNLVSNGDYIDQTLGDWLVAADKMNLIKYLIGIELESRIVVSIIQVDNPEKIIDQQGNSKVRFSEVKAIYSWSDGKVPLQLEESLLWNARNPIRYLN